MRIGLFHGTLPEPGRKVGGVEVHVHRLASRLAARGHDVSVLSFWPKPPDAAYRHRLLPLAPAARSSRAFRQYGGPLVLNAVRTSDLDVLHLHGDDWFYLRRRVPTVRTFHGSAIFEAVTATSWRRRLNNGLLFGLERLSARLATSTHGVGTDSQTLYGKGFETLECGVDVAPLNGRPVAAAPTILFVGNWDGRKRGRLLHRVFTEQVRPRVPDARLVMVSDACEPAPGVEWRPSISDEELDRALAESWVFCMPSSYEGYGIPYVEAMARGVPVVASPNLGATRLIDDGRTGLLPRDEQLGQALVGLLGDAGERERLAAAAHERARDFAWDVVLDRHEAVYARAIERFSRR